MLDLYVLGQTSEQENLMVEQAAGTYPQIRKEINAIAMQFSNMPWNYQSWLDRADLVLPEYAGDVFAKILSYTPEAINAIVWITHMALQEVHDHEFERFLILEGNCNIQVEDQTFHLAPGDYFQIPLHKNHQVTVTSESPCKVILQRVA